VCTATVQQDVQPQGGSVAAGKAGRLANGQCILHPESATLSLKVKFTNRFANKEGLRLGTGAFFYPEPGAMNSPKCPDVFSADADKYRVGEFQYGRCRLLESPDSLGAGVPRGPQSEDQHVSVPCRP